MLVSSASAFCLLAAVLVGLVGLSVASPLMQGQELLVQNPEDGSVRYMQAPAKKSASFRQSLRSLLQALRVEEMAEAEEEEAEEEAEAAAAGQRPLEALEMGDGDEPVALPSALHAVDKRRGRRYGFWVTAINKMGTRNLKSFLGKHRNIYNVYKRSQGM